MKKRVLILMATAVLTLGVVTAAYAKDNITSNKLNNRASMMFQDDVNGNSYSNMVDLMRNNGFETAAEAMENRDYDAMTSFMNNMTDEQYNEMIEIMKSNGYEGMGRMMESVDKEVMINMHNSMMGKGSTKDSQQ